MNLLLDDNQMEKVKGITTEYPYVLTVTNFKHLFHQTVTWHWHEEVEFCYLKKGTLRIYTNDRKVEIHEGEGYLINTSIMNMKVSVDPERPAVEVAHIFHPILVGGTFHSIYEMKYVRPITMNPHLEVVNFSNATEYGKKILEILRKLVNISKKEDSEFEVRGMLSEAWILLLHEINDYVANLPQETDSSRSRLQYMIAYIHRHYSEKITLEDIAKSAHISTREATRCFKKIRERTPVDYLIDYRLGMARQMLLETEESITDIAINTGFGDSAYFGKMFRKHFGMSPVEYRKAEQQNVPEPIDWDDL